MNAGALRAAQRLADRTVRVCAVAQDVGYESAAAFSRAFQYVVGRLSATCGSAWTALLSLNIRGHSRDFRFLLRP